MKKALTSIIFAAGLTTAGCDIDVNENTTPPMSADEMSVDADINSPAENRMDRREERRENLREAVDNVDVHVGDGGVSVDVDRE